MCLWFWGDTHFWHANIIKYCNRPFSNVDEMNSIIIRKFNERVKDGDLVFFLGDLGFKSGTGRGEGEPHKPQEILTKLNCSNIIFCNGNHDTKGRNGFKTPIKSIVIEYGGSFMNLTHNPEHANFNYPINLVGHVHEKWFCKRLFNKGKFTDCINVGVDVWNFYPVSWDEINSRYIKWKKEYEKTNKI
jgi:calcineurin-like phosphoesterase family protein